MSFQSSSSLRQFGQRDDRRRRLLADDLSSASDWPAAASRSEESLTSGKSQNYGDAEFLDQQLRLRDLVPRRAISLVGLLLAATAVLVALEAAYAWTLGHAASGGAAVAAFDLAAKGSLGCWFSSLVLLAAAMTAVLIFNIRRHRIDDYQGRYRIWLWGAACWFVMATDQAASLREGFRGLTIALTSLSLVGDSTLWWVALYAVALGAIGSRLLVDMRSCPLSVGTLLTAGGAYALAAATWLGWILPDGGARASMFLAGAEIVGHLTILGAMLLYARHVILDAEGLLPRREPKLTAPLAAEEQAVAPTQSSWRKIDPPHSVPIPRAAASVSTTVSTAANHKLTKAERRALKERLLRERLDRQRRGE